MVWPFFVPPSIHSLKTIKNFVIIEMWKSGGTSFQTLFWKRLMFYTIWKWVLQKLFSDLEKHSETSILEKKNYILERVFPKVFLDPEIHSRISNPKYKIEVQNGCFGSHLWIHKYISEHMIVFFFIFWIRYFEIYFWNFKNIFWKT